MTTDLLHQTKSPTSSLTAAGLRASRRALAWPKLLLGVVILVAVVGVAALLIRGSGSPSALGPIRTHVIQRDNLTATVTEQGTLESSDNTEIKCRVRGDSTIIQVIEPGTIVMPGDVLVKLDTLAIEDAIAERTKYAHLTRSGAERAKADVAASELAIKEYLEGRFVVELKELQKQLAINRAMLESDQALLEHAQMMAERGVEVRN